jgi:uncharacterized protein YdcH (DUF465 family)
MSKDFIKIARKINQLKKRISRDEDNPGHNSKIKTRIRKKRLQELQKSLLNGKKNSANRS